MRQHFVPHCFDLANVGGLSSALGAETSANGRQVIFMAPDSPESKTGNIEVRSADQLQPGQPDRWELWFDAGFCQLMFPEAYTVPSASREAVRCMLQADADRESQHPIGSLERLFEFVDRFQPGWEIGSHFTRRFNRLIDAIPPDAVMNWQSFFFEPGVNEHAEALRARGVKQTFHLHEALPDSLHLSEWGRRFLSAMSKVDHVYVHTDLFVRRLELQLELLGLPAPAISRFDLGIDREFVRRSLCHVTRGNYRETIPEFTRLAPVQQAFISAVFQSQDRVPHRFICIDRADPVKGVDVLLKGIDLFLRDRLAAGETIAEQYRFFFIQNGPAGGSGKPHLTSQRYAEYCDGLLQELIQMYPGVILRCDALRGPQRLALPALMLGCHGITGSPTEGLSLAIMENAKVNEGQDTTIICGSGAGFAHQVREHGNSGLAEFPTAGNPDEFRAALARTARLQAESRGSLGGRKLRLVREEVDPRRDSVIVDPLARVR